MSLILPQTIKVKITTPIFRYFKEKGYEFKKCGDIIDINVLDLRPGSHTKVKCECDYCGALMIIEYRDYIKSKNNNKLLCCNNVACKNKKYEDTCMAKYNVTNVSQLQAIKNKKIETCRKNFGVDHPFQSDEVQDKSAKTLKEKYGEGITSAAQVAEVQEKIKQTNTERYGHPHALQSEEIKKKMKETNNRKYGVDSYTQTKEYKDKSKKTCQLHYGVDNPSQAQEVKDKKKETCQLHYGCDWALQDKGVREKSIKTWQEKYGEDIINPGQAQVVKNKIKKTWKENYGQDIENPFQVDSVKEKIRQTNVEKYGVENPMQDEKIRNKALDSFQFNSTGPSSRAQRYICYILNGILNKSICGSLADIYLEKENIIIEHDGGGHFLKDKMNGNLSPTKESLLYEKQREDKIINNGFRMIRFIATKDRIPSDEVILNLIKEFKNLNFKVVRIDFEKGTIDIDYNKKTIHNFGRLRNITKKDLEPFEKQEDDTSKN